MEEYLLHAWCHIDLASHLHLDTHNDYNNPQSGRYVDRTINDPAPTKWKKNGPTFAKHTSVTLQFNRTGKVCQIRVHTLSKCTLCDSGHIYCRDKAPVTKLLTLQLDIQTTVEDLMRFSIMSCTNLLCGEPFIYDSSSSASCTAKITNRYAPKLKFLNTS